MPKKLRNKKNLVVVNEDQRNSKMQKKVRRINIPSFSSNFLAPQLELPHRLDNDHLLDHLLTH